MSNLVSKEWLLEQMQSEASKISIVDVRFRTGTEEQGIEAYKRGHLPGAVFIDLKNDLADSPGKHGGRSPLPSPERLAERFGKLGMTRDVPVIVYDDDLRPEAARLWWILRYLGHQHVYILDGGYAGWKAAGYPQSSDITEATSRKFEVDIQHNWLADVNEVGQKLNQAGVILLDSRDWQQYAGKTAPLDPVAGHIPGALHAFWKDGLHEDGRLKDSLEQQKRFGYISPDDEVIVYCGSGLSACPNVLALQEAGFHKVKLYAGSWSDWISYEGNPIATSETS
ncbi:sulfurtransferase [Paenibacillus sp. JCM 10914]|uniref:sulfurtransferase n=1 Tax=Paenibacillus sp. JCM 10914 TaxID=1236974 RepID=UPI0003CC395C|nr:sulfurtransferase [Paenibacillus sp. JCM 10914]GAE05782.1 thiosulfate sulfurtransferase, rhodanese [Paenibacillus sp. JCM 10914]